MDSTHTNAAVRPKPVTQVLRELSKELRREIYREMVELSEKFPEKPSETAELADEIEYTRWLLESVKAEILDSGKSGLICLCERIQELLDTDRIREIRSKDDTDLQSEWYYKKQF